MATAANVSYRMLTVLGALFRSELPVIERIWKEFGRALLDANAITRFRDDSWEQDWFLAKYAQEDSVLGIRAFYAPPADVDAFPLFDLQSQLWHFDGVPGARIRRCRSMRNHRAVFHQPPQHAFVGPYAVDRVHELRGRIAVDREPGTDPPRVQFNQAIAWLHGALGKLFGGVALTPFEGDPQRLVALCTQRWNSIWAHRDVYEDDMSIPELLQWKLDVFHGAAIQPVGLSMQPSLQGQPVHWREKWLWLAAPTAPENALAATQLAAELMASLPVLLFLKREFAKAAEALADKKLDDESLLAVLLLRRWLLQLQVMAWLETALQHRWRHVRTEDLTSFAFSALRPHWPRRLFALSHRSKDVKPALSRMKAWNDFRYSLDATFVPHWETNVSMVWGLFSAVPALIRIESADYDKSIWCLRERELFDYLCERDDFLDGRCVIELGEGQLPLLDRVLGNDARPRGLVPLGSHPPRTPVFMVYPFEAWQCRLLACVAAVRLLFLRLRDPAATGLVCVELARGTPPPRSLDPFTNHPAGWAPLMRLFEEFQAEWGEDTQSFALGAGHEAYGEAELQRDLESLDSIIDLRDGFVDQTAALAAMEWNRTVGPALVGDRRYGSSFAVDYRQLTQQEWAQRDELMVVRGLNRIRTFAPLWILQREGQHVDEWPGVGSSPIFTEHVPDQWHWMDTLSPARDWPVRFQTDCKLRFSAKLSAACAATASK